MLQFLKTGYQKIKEALSKTRASLSSKIRTLFGRPWDDETLESLEQILYETDLGTSCVAEFVEYLQKNIAPGPQTNVSFILEELKKKSLAILKEPPATHPIPCKEGEPLCILIIGVNGSGKTTSIAKLASHFRREGKKVLLAAGDTFRAAAIDQITLWAEKLHCDIVKSTPRADPSSLAFDALTAAKARGSDVVLLDTAGRLQNKTELMQELEKMKRTCKKIFPDAPHETLLVIDATTGQNALDQTRIFHAHLPLTGLILTKLDGSAKGGIALSIYKELKIPIRWIGVGEKAEDLLPFKAEDYVEALLGEDS
jgi:fused signal recognition particle receptor